MSRDTTKYSFNGKNNLAKNQLVLEVVKKYVEDNQNIAYEELKKIFPDNLQGSLGVIRNEVELQSLNIADPEKRFFMKTKDIIKLNNMKIYVSKGWGDKWIDSKTGKEKEGNKEKFLKFARNKLQYDIKEEYKIAHNIKFIDNREEVSIENENKNMKTKNIMLYGSPGVGKTHNYKRLITMIENGNDERTIFDTISKNEKTNDEDDKTFQNIKDDKRIEFVTFHQSYSYEDFIEGFRPRDNGNIKLENGIFKKLCEGADKNSQKNFYIVIDEINRGNISKIFGELITLIEEDKRGKKEYEVTLPYSKTSFLVPENLFIIATMNSTDKSIATIDIALRRRFTFLKMLPNPKLVKDENKQKLMMKLNEFISNKDKGNLGEDYMLGHSYFMNDLDINFIKEYKIKPLLEEYFYGDDANYKEAIKILDIKTI